MLLKKQRIPLLISLSSGIAVTLMGMQPSPARQLVLLAMAAIWFCTLLYYIIRSGWQWRTELYAGTLAVALLCAGPVLGAMAAPTLRTAGFARDLPRYEAAVRWAASRALPGQEVRLEPPQQFADLGSVVFVRSSSPCGLTVDFLWAGGFPVRHVLRRYAALPQQQPSAACSESVMRSRPLAPHWFELSD